MKKIKYQLIVLILAFPSLMASGQNDTLPQCKSQVKVFGSSNITEFILLNDSPEIIRENKGHMSEDTYQVIKVPVDSFYAENKGMLKDFREMVQSDKFPYITIAIERRDLAECDEKSQPMDFKTRITMAGVVNNYVVPCTLDSCENSTYALNGQLDLNVADFGMNPPSKLLGIIKVNEVVSVDYVFIFNEDDPIFQKEADLIPSTTPPSTSLRASLRLRSGSLVRSFDFAPFDYAQGAW